MIRPANYTPPSTTLADGRKYAFDKGFIEGDIKRDMGTNPYTIDYNICYIEALGAMMAAGNRDVVKLYHECITRYEAITGQTGIFDRNWRG